MNNVFVTVNYGNESVTIDFIESYLKNTNIQKTILYVVDNTNDKSGCKSIEQKYAGKGVTFLYPLNNLGYMKGGSYAYDYHYNKFGIDFDFFCLMNNDVVFSDDTLEGKLEKVVSEEVMLISPSVIDDGVNVNPYLLVRKSKLYMMFWSFALLDFYLFRFIQKIIPKIKRNKAKKIDNSAVEQVYGTHGSVFILSSAFFKNKGSLRDLPFLYGEEMFISEQIKNLGGTCVYVPEIRFYHQGSATLGKDCSKFKYKCIKEAHKFICDRYY